MQITILPPDSSAQNNSLELAVLTEEVSSTLRNTAIATERFECPDIECGAVFSYRRVSCGHFVPPNFCPMCGGPMDATPQDHDSDFRMIAEVCQSSRGLILP